MAVGEEYEARDTVQELAGLSREEEVEAAAGEGVLARAAAAAAAAVLAQELVAGPSWTSVQSFGPPLRRQLRRPCRASRPSTHRQWRHIWRRTSGDEASTPSCERTSATSAALQGTRNSPPSRKIWS